MAFKRSTKKTINDQVSEESNPNCSVTSLGPRPLALVAGNQLALIIGAKPITHDIQTQQKYLIHGISNVITALIEHPDYVALTTTKGLWSPHVQ